MPYRRVRQVDWTFRILYAHFAIVMLLGLPASRNITFWFIAVASFALIWWIGGKLTTTRIKNATTNWRLTYYPDQTAPPLLRFIESLGADLGGQFDNLTPQTPLADMDWTTLQPKLSMDIKHPCKRWVDFVLNEANIEGIDTGNLGQKTLDDLVNQILAAGSDG